MSLFQSPHDETSVPHANDFWSEERVPTGVLFDAFVQAEGWWVPGCWLTLSWYRCPHSPVRVTSCGDDLWLSHSHRMQKRGTRVQSDWSLRAEERGDCSYLYPIPMAGFCAPDRHRESLSWRRSGWTPHQKIRTNLRSDSDPRNPSGGPRYRSCGLRSGDWCRV